ncbi:MAG: DUF354 domain-containing protein [Candidatus Asgardarchaeia archaeon]
MTNEIVWIDLLTPKQVLFFKKVSEKLNAHGIKTLFTARKYREVTELIKLKQIHADIIGQHGGSDLKRKLVESARRIIALTEWVSENTPQLALSFSSPEASRVAFGLKIPHISANDSPHSIPVAKLSLPLSDLLITSSFIPVKKWIKFGIRRKQIVTYKAIDQAAWIKDFTPDNTILSRLGLENDTPIITVREAETWAAYYPKNGTIAMKVAKKILKELKNIQLVIIPRYREQIDVFKKKLPSKNVLVLDKIIDTTSLIYFSDVFIGSGGTMNGEAALLGVPNVSTFPKITLDINKYLIKQGLLIKTRNVRKIINFIKKVLSDENFRNEYKNRSQQILNWMEDPAEIIANVIGSFLKV